MIDGKVHAEAETIEDAQKLLASESQVRADGTFPLVVRVPRTYKKHSYSKTCELCGEKFRHVKKHFAFAHRAEWEAKKKEEEARKATSQEV